MTGLRKRIVRDLNRVIAPLECLCGDARAPLRRAPIFVVGPPRSGTTLLVQTIAAAFDVRYFSNLLNACCGAPSIAARLARPFVAPPRADFTSDLGNTRPWLGFSEGPTYWLRFFPERPHVLAAGDVPPEALARLRIAVGRLVHALDRPVLFKTITNSARIDPIAAALPEALFLVARRPLIETAHSLLEGRWKRYGSYEPWLSVEPPGFEELASRPPWEQVVEQIVRTHELVDRDAERIGRHRFLDVEYDDLCTDPHALLRRIGAFASLDAREAAAWERIPRRFPRRAEVRLPAEIYLPMVEYAEMRMGTREPETRSPLRQAR